MRRLLELIRRVFEYLLSWVCGDSGDRRTRWPSCLPGAFDGADDGPRARNDAPGGPNDEMPAWQKWFTLIALPIILALLAYCVVRSFDDAFGVHRPSYNATLDNLELAFPSQPSHIWTMVRALHENSLRGRVPSVLTVLANVADRRLLNRFSVSIGFALANSHSPPWSVVRVNGTEVHEISSPKKTLMLTFYKQKKFVAVVNDVETMDASFVSLFHSLIDDMSWFNGSIFIFTISTPENVEAMSRDKYGLAAERVLNAAWRNQLKLTYRSALVSRLTSNTVALRPEKSSLNGTARTESSAS